MAATDEWWLYEGHEINSFASRCDDVTLSMFLLDQVEHFEFC